MPDFAKSDFFLPECTSRIDFSTAQKNQKMSQRRQISTKLAGNLHEELKRIHAFPF